MIRENQPKGKHWRKEGVSIAHSAMATALMRWIILVVEWEEGCSRYDYLDQRRLQIVAFQERLAT